MAMVLAVSIAFGQKNVTQTASNMLRNGKLDKALDAINQSILDPSTAQDAKTWFLRGNIYLELSNKEGKLIVGMKKSEVESLLGKPKSVVESVFYDMKTELLEYDNIYVHIDDNKLVGWTKYKDGSSHPNVEDLQSVNLTYSLESYKKAMEYDTKKKFYEDILAKLNWQRNNLYNQAVDAYNQATTALNNNQPEAATENYLAAMNYFAGAVDVIAVVDLVDTVAMLNTAYCATLAEDVENAKKYYLMLLEAGYQTPAIFVSLSDIYRGQEDVENALKIIQQGKEAFPGDPTVFLGETSVFLTFNMTDQAQTNLLEYIEIDTMNASVYYALGTIYNKIVDDTAISDDAVKKDAFDKAINAYQRALDLNTEYFEAYYNFGALYVSEAALIDDEANSLPLDEVAEYERLKGEANKYLMLAAPYLEKAIEMQPNDVNALQTLRQIYARTKQKEKLKEVNAKIDSVTQ